MSIVTAMDGIGDVNHVDTVHDNISEEYKQAMEKAMKNQEEVKVTEEKLESVTPVEKTVDEETMQMSQIPQGPMDIWLQFDTISVGSGERRATFDLAKLLAGIEKLADVTMVREDSNNKDSTKGE